MAIVLLDFVEKALRVAKRWEGTRGSPNQEGFPARRISSLTVFARKRATPSPSSLIESVSCPNYVISSTSIQTRCLIRPRSTIRLIGTRCTSGGRCCALRRSNSVGPATSHWTARFSTASKPLSTISSGAAAPSRRSKRRR